MAIESRKKKENKEWQSKAEKNKKNGNRQPEKKRLAIDSRKKKEKKEWQSIAGKKKNGNRQPI